MGAGAGPPSPQQGQQDPLSPPGILKTLMGAIPVVGPGIYHRSLLELALKRHREDQQIQADNNLFGIAQQYAENKDKILDPDTQNQWQQMVGEMALAKHGNPAKPFDKEIGQKFQDLHGFTKGQIASKQAAVPSQISNMPPPPASFGPTAGGIPLNGAPGPASAPSTPGLPGLLPQGAGAPKVPASPQGPAFAPQQPMEMTPPPGMPQNDPMAILQAQSQDPNPLVRGPAINQLRNLVMAQAQATGKLQIVQQQLAASGRKLEDLPIEAQMDLLTGQPIRNLPPLNPGQQVPSLGGGMIATSSVPRLQDVAPGGTLVSVPTAGGQPATSGGGAPAMPPPPSAGAQTLLKSPGKVKEGPTFPDPASKTGYSQYQLDEVNGQIRGKLDVVPPRGMVPTEETSQGFERAEQPDGSIALIPKTTTSVRRPLLGGGGGGGAAMTPPPGQSVGGGGGGAPPPGATPAPASSGLPPGSFIIGAKAMTPQQRETNQQNSNALDDVTQVMTRIGTKLPLLNNLITAGKIQLATSPGIGAQLFTRATKFSDDETQLVADLNSAKEGVNQLRTALRAQGFRGHEAFAAMQQQAQAGVKNPDISRKVLQTTVKTLLGQRSAIQKELAKANGLAKPKLDPETAKAYMFVTGGDAQKAVDLATSQGYEIPPSAATR